MNKLLLELIQQNHGQFKLALSVTGTALEQFVAKTREPFPRLLNKRTERRSA